MHKYTACHCFRQAKGVLLTVVTLSAVPTMAVARVTVRDVDTPVPPVERSERTYSLADRAEGWTRGLDGDVAVPRFFRNDQRFLKPVSISFNGRMGVLLGALSEQTGVQVTTDAVWLRNFGVACRFKNKPLWKVIDALAATYLLECWMTPQGTLKLTSGRHFAAKAQKPSSTWEEERFRLGLKMIDDWAALPQEERDRLTSLGSKSPEGVQFALLPQPIQMAIRGMLRSFVAERFANKRTAPFGEDRLSDASVRLTMTPETDFTSYFIDITLPKMAMVGWRFNNYQHKAKEREEAIAKGKLPVYVPSYKKISLPEVNAPDTLSSMGQSGFVTFAQHLAQPYTALEASLSGSDISFVSSVNLSSQAIKKPLSVSGITLEKALSVIEETFEQHFIRLRSGDVFILRREQPESLALKSR